MPDRALRILGLLLALWLPSGGALGWGEEGHRIAGAIAYKHLTPEARRQVFALLKDDRLADGQRSHRRTLGEIAYWADEIKDTPWGRSRGAWHFDILADARASPRRKNEALKWVVHLAGDVHQPLHAATHDDRGGNDVQVSFLGERDNPPYGTINLHAIWDVHMVRRLILDKGGENAIVSPGTRDTERAAWERG